jgi:hypothetical protein
VYYGFARGIDLVHALDDLAERDKLCAGNARVIVFALFAHVDELNVFARVEALFKF